MTDTRDRWIGVTLGNRVTIEEAVGKGRTGPVYRAREATGREVAVKLIQAPSSQGSTWEQGFMTQARACAALEHPNTVRIYDVSQTRLGQTYLVSELLSGTSLASIILSEPPMSPSRVLRILMQCCASLDEAHSAGILHGNIGAEKIMVQRHEGDTDSIKLFGFSMGIRSHNDVSAGGTAMNSQHFMSPELGLGESADLRSDLYSLGVLAYAMLSGRLPFEDSDPKEVLRMHREETVPPLPDAVPGAVSMLVMSCLEKEARRRPPSAATFSYACKLGLKELSPKLDLRLDPVLKHTLLRDASDTVLDVPPEFATPVGPMQTMLGVGLSDATEANDERDQVATVSHTSPTRIDDSDQQQTILREPHPKLAASETMPEFGAGKRSAASLTYPVTEEEAPKELALQPGSSESTAKTAYERPSQQRKLVAPDQAEVLAGPALLPPPEPRSLRGILLIPFVLLCLGMGAYYYWIYA